MKNIVVKFGQSLDADDFETTASLLSPDCLYKIGDEALTGPKEICNSYEQNMIEGRKKLDKLEWGKSHVEPLSAAEFYVHFTDYLTHQGKSHIHRCKQKLTINAEGLISKIEHIDDAIEQQKLTEFYQQVGLK